MSTNLSTRFMNDPQGVRKTGSGRGLAGRFESWREKCESCNFCHLCKKNYFFIIAKILEMSRTSFLNGDSSDAIDPNHLKIYIQSKTNLKKKITENLNVQILKWPTKVFSVMTLAVIPHLQIIVEW